MLKFTVTGTSKTVVVSPSRDFAAPWELSEFYFTASFALVYDS